MKKITVVLFFIGTFVANAQKYDEIKLDVFDILALKTLDVSYERVLNTESSFGLSLLFNFENSVSFRYKEDFVLTPYYRQFLLESGNVNFFGEVFGAFSKGNDDHSESGDYTDFAFGLGFGGKYLSEMGFIIDINVGVGRNLFNNTSPEVLFRGGISIGKQF